MTPATYLFGISEFTTHPWSFEQDVETYARLGVSAMELCEFKLSDTDFDRQIALPGTHGLTITSVQPKTRTLFPSQSQPEPQDLDERMARFRATIKRLAPHVPGVAFVTNTGIPPQGNIQTVFDACAKSYRELADFAADHGVKVALEPLNASIMNIESAIWTLPQAMQIVEAVGRDNFGICLDCWNVWQNAALDRAIRKCGDRIFVVQVSDWRPPQSYQDRLVPGRGEIPLASFFKAVRDTGFDGAYSVEIFSGGVPDSLWQGDLEQVIWDSRAGTDAAWKESLALEG